MLRHRSMSLKAVKTKVQNYGLHDSKLRKQEEELACRYDFLSNKVPK